MSKPNESSLGLASLTHIRNSLDRIFTKGTWHGWELETISDELKMSFDELTRDKIHILQLIEKDPELFFTNATFFLHAVVVMNNQIADFDRLPMPTSLELAYALAEVKKLLGDRYHSPAPDSMVSDVIGYLLKEEGYSEPVEPFGFVPKTCLEKGQTEADTMAKKKAIETYIQAMDNL
jgi:hypothetical protein